MICVEGQRAWIHRLQSWEESQERRGAPQRSRVMFVEWGCAICPGFKIQNTYGGPVDLRYRRERVVTAILVLLNILLSESFPCI